MVIYRRHASPENAFLAFPWAPAPELQPQTGVNYAPDEAVLSVFLY